MSTENKASANKHFWIRFESYYKREQTFKKSIIYKKNKTLNHQYAYQVKQKSYKDKNVI